MRNKIVVFFVIVALIAMIIIPLVGCTNGDDTETTTNPIVALQEDVGELNDNFNTEVANIKSRLSTLETSSIPANITNRVTTLEANVAALQVTVNALSAGDSVDLTALTEAVNNIADDVLAVNSSIDVIRGDVNNINLDITDLKNKYNSITIPDYDSRIQEVELRIVSILSSMETYGTDITDIKADIVDMINDIALNADNISVLNNELNNVKSRLSALESNNSNKAEIVSANWIAGNTYQVDCKINKTGNYAIILTLYGKNVDNISVKAKPGYDLTTVENDYGNPKTMKVVILTPDSIQLSGSTIAPAEYWIAGNTFSIQYDTAITATDIDCVSISTGVR